MSAASPAFAALADGAARLGIGLDDQALGVCERFAAALAERNRSVNLTAITDPRDVAIRHFLDSLTALAVRVWQGSERIVDVGSGAGFPGLALRIALPGSAVLVIESVGKKARWLEEVAGLLGLTGVRVVNARAESLGAGPPHRAAHDVATARAVTSLAASLEYLLPLVAIGGDAVVWKGRLDEELPAAERACSTLGGEIRRVVSTAELGVGELLPGRHLVVVRKVAPTPKAYPRPAAEAKRRPW